jgi:hypothetical protein
MKLHKSDKGIGTVVASIMFLLIAILFIGGTFLWQSTSEAHMNAFEKDRMDEGLSVEASYVYNDMTGFYDTQLKVKNTGPIDIQIVQAWIIDEDHNEHQHVSCYYAIPVDSFDNLAEIETLKTSLENPFDIEHTTYFFRIVTERGNIASSRLMPRAAFLSNWPAVIVPEASWVRREGSGGLIQLVIYNKLSDPIHLALIVASRLEHGSEHSELIEVDMIVAGGTQEVLLENGDEGQIYQSGEIVFIELADTDGIVVSSYYFTCQ